MKGVLKLSRYRLVPVEGAQRLDYFPQQGHKPAALRSDRSLATLSEPVIGFSPDAGRPGLRL